MSIWPVFDGVEQLQRDSGFLQGFDGHRYAGIFELGTPIVAGSVVTPNALSAIAVDDTHVYVGDTSTNKIRKYLKSDMSFVAESVSYGGVIKALAVDADYVYVVGWSVYRIRKYNKSDLSFVAESPAYGANIYAMAIDDTYVYIGGDMATVRKYLKSSFEFVAESVTYGGQISAIAVDSTHVYVGGVLSDSKVQKLLKSTLGLVTQSGTLNSSINAIALDADSVYVGFQSGAGWKLSKDDLSQQATLYGSNALFALAVDATSVYGGLQSSPYLARYTKELTLLANGPSSYGGSPSALAHDGQYLFCAGSPKKVDKDLFDVYEIKGYGRVM